METTSGADRSELTPATRAVPDWRHVANAAVIAHRAIQDVHELAILLAIADSISPRVVLEIGTFAGGTAWALAQLPTVQHVITVDTDYQPEAAGALSGWGGTASLISGRSHDTATHLEVARQLAYRPVDLLLIDGAHDYESARGDWQDYAPLVRIGGLVALHDITPHRGQPDVQVWQLWEEIAATHQATEVVTSPGEWAGLGLVWK